MYLLKGSAGFFKLSALLIMLFAFGSLLRPDMLFGAG